MDLEEADTILNESTTISLPVSEWFIESSNTYTMMVAVEYGEKVTHKTCLNLGLEESTYTGASASYESCSEWVEQPKNYIFHVKLAN